jgi:hypothetical protein
MFRDKYNVKSNAFVVDNPNILNIFLIYFLDIMLLDNQKNMLLYLLKLHINSLTIYSIHLQENIH